jgi:hypothetical protein
MLSSSVQEMLAALDKLSEVMDSYHQSSSSTEKAKTSMFSSMFRRESVKHKPTPEGEYADTRHGGQLRILLAQLLGGDLPFDRYPALGTLRYSTVRYAIPQHTTSYLIMSHQICYAMLYCALLTLRDCTS